MADPSFSYLAASASQSVDYQGIDPFQLSLFPVSSANTMSIAAPVMPIHRSGVATTSRNGGSNQILGPFFCRWEGCPMANRQFLTGDAIWRHLEVVHFDARVRTDDGLTCRWLGCDETRPSLFRLKSHMRKHLDWRPFGCHLCDERFKHRGDQKKHLARKHGNVTGTRKSFSKDRKDRKEQKDQKDQKDQKGSTQLQPQEPQSPPLQYSYTPISLPSASQPVSDGACLPVSYYVSNQVASSDVADAYPVYTSVAPSSLTRDVTSSATPPPMLTSVAVTPEQQQQLMANTDMTSVQLSSLMSSPDLKYESTTQSMTNLLKDAPNLEGVCGWLQNAAYAQPISQADDDEEDRRSWSSFGPEKTPESILPSDMIKSSPFLAVDASALSRYATPPTMADDHLTDVPTSLISLPPPTVFDGFGCYLGMNEQDPQLVNYEQLELTNLAV